MQISGLVILFYVKLPNYAFAQMPPFHFSDSWQLLECIEYKLKLKEFLTGLGLFSFLLRVELAKFYASSSKKSLNLTKFVDI